MADSVVKLRLDSGEYDSKIKRAAQNVLAFGENCQKAGQSVAKAEKETLDYVRSIGQMETVAKNTKGKINEMTTAFTELSMQYKQLSAQEKQSPFGQALSQSLDQLKTRIGESKAQLTEVNAELGNTSKQSNETGGVLDALAGKFGLNVSQLGKLGSALGVTTAAVKVAKDAFFASEQNLDDWNRAIYTSQSVYEGFLTSLNTGDISGYISRINEIVVAAKRAYDALDLLATQKALSAGPLGGMKTEAQRFDAMLRTGTWISDPTKDSGGMKDGQKLTPSQIQAIKKMRVGLQQRMTSTYKTLVGTADKALSELYNESALRYGLSKSDFMAGTRDLATYNANMEGYKKYKQFEAEHTTKQNVSTGYLGGGTRTKWVRDNAVNPYAKYRAWGVFKDDGKLQDAIRQTEQERNSMMGEYYGSESSMYRLFNRVDTKLGGGGGRAGGGRTGGGSGRGGSHQETPQEKADKMVVSALQNYGNTISIASMMLENGMINREDYMKKELSAQERLAQAYAEAYNVYNDEKYKTAFEDAATEYRDLADIVKGKREEFEKATEQLAGMSVNPIDGILNQLLGESMEDYAKRKNIDLNTGKGGGKKSDWAEQTSKNIDKYLSPISTISSGLQEMGVKVPEGIERVIAITQGVSTILAGISALVALIQVDTKMTAVATTTDAIIPGFARGGVAHAAGGLLTGHHFSGDNVPVMVNDGELILNRAQQGVIADALGGGGSPVIQIEGRITGEDIELVQRNRNRRTGRGEYVTTKKR